MWGVRGEWGSVWECEGSDVWGVREWCVECERVVCGV